MCGFGKVKLIQKEQKQMVQLLGKVSEQFLFILNPLCGQDYVSTRTREWIKIDVTQ